MTLVGFKRATIGVLDADGNTLSTHVIEGKQNEGATSTAEINGLSAAATKAHGSNIAYYVSQRGTGNITANLGVLDLPDAVNDVLLGYKVVEETGISYIGNDTEPPYCSVLLESSNLQGATALFGLFKGKFSKETIAMNTLNSDESFTPEAETFVFTAIEDDKEGDSNGQAVGKYVGSDETAITALRDQVLPTTPEG